jgi:regulator of sigma E protease
MMDHLTTPAAFVLVLGVIIFFHEFGHFITAKAFGMRVYIFSFGFGRRLLGFKWGDTDCRLSRVPLGGYVKLEGEAEDHLSEDTSGLGDGRDFVNRPRWQRFVVYLAGPFMNGVLAVAVFTALYMAGFGVDASRYDRPIVGAVQAGSPAEAAGLQPADEILAIDDKPQANWEEVLYDVALRPDRELRLRVRRGGQDRDVSVRSTSLPPHRMGQIGVAPVVRIGEVMAGEAAAQAGLRPDDGILRIGDTPIQSFDDIPPIVRGAGDRPLKLTVYRAGTISEMSVTPRKSIIGIRPKVIVKQFPFVQAVPAAVGETWRMTQETVGMLKGLLTARISAKAAVSGPLGIAQASGMAARGGWRQLFALIAGISISVGILNLFPLAPLDGGHLAILAGEGLIRRNFNLTVKAWFMNAGFGVLLLLIAFVLYSDLSKTAWLGKYLP